MYQHCRSPILELGEIEDKARAMCLSVVGSRSDTPPNSQLELRIRRRASRSRVSITQLSCPLLSFAPSW